MIARQNLPSSLSPFFLDVIARIEPISESLKSQAQKKVDFKTKPPGAPGRIEQLAIQLRAIRKSLNPSTYFKRMFVFAGDHGVVEKGVQK
ncbi:MAG: nicotinate-nucleotide--dimethylbenzimidazole phosphoribosyltransferase [Proteobacteria bacterium]|nr:nicotinate-nucleotide--dimethylbenzimidazole phosphoribosyltransferase [Pseudomonadota bacterium]